MPSYHRGTLRATGLVFGGNVMTAEKARIVAICHLIEENNRHLLIYLENELERPLRL